MTITAAGHIYVSASKVHLRATELADGYFITDVAAPLAYFVRPSAHVYMEARRSTLLTRLFVPVDPMSPCQQWRTMAQLAEGTERNGWRCIELGEQTLDGRSALVYRALHDDREQFTAWVDPTLGFPLQIRLPDGVIFAAQSIQDQPASNERLDIPDGFRKFDPATLLDRVKQSDVWVEEN